MLKQALLPAGIIIGGFALAAVIVATGPELKQLPPPSNVLPVRTWLAESRSVQLSSFTHGEVAPRIATDLVPEVSGRVIWMSESLVSGGFFSSGDTLMKIEPLDYELALEQSRAALASAESELANATKAYQRQLDLAEKQSTSESQRDDARNRKQLAEAKMREALAGVAKAERDLARTSIEASFDGRVRSERVDVGQFVSRGTPVASLYSTDVAEVRLPLPDEELAFLRLPLDGVAAAGVASPRVILRTRFGGAEHEWEGTIVRTEGELDPQTRMINVIAQVEAPYRMEGDRPPLAVGLFVEAEIIGRQVDDVFVIPRSALQANNQVYIVDSENRLVFRDVTILRTVEEEVYISAGLRPGDVVCLTTLAHAIEGMTVRPVNASGANEA